MTSDALKRDARDSEVPVWESPGSSGSPTGKAPLMAAPLATRAPLWQQLAEQPSSSKLLSPRLEPSGCRPGSCRAVGGSGAADTTAALDVVGSQPLEVPHVLSGRWRWDM